jgi:hypothetical protein
MRHGMRHKNKTAEGAIAQRIAPSWRPPADYAALIRPYELMPQRTNSISLNRHCLVKNGSSGL